MQGGSRDAAAAEVEGAADAAATGQGRNGRTRAAFCPEYLALESWVDAGQRSPGITSPVS